MRLPLPAEDLVGKVCVCSVGRVAVVVGQKTFDWGQAWVGLGLDGKGTWASKEPAIVAESAIEFHDRLVERFDGRMTRNG